MTLRAFMKLNLNKIDEENYFEVCWRLLQILYHIYQKGYVHRDIKPSNIMISKLEKPLYLKKPGSQSESNQHKYASVSKNDNNSGTEKFSLGFETGPMNDGSSVIKHDLSFKPSYKVTVIDFGLCITTFDKDTRIKLMQKICGTKGYICPEIITSNTEKKRENLDWSKIDIYSVGVILYELMTKKNPFTAQISKDILRNNAKGIIDFTHEKIMGLTEERKDLLMKLCEKNPDKRLNAGEALMHPALWEFENYMFEEDRNDDLAKFRDGGLNKFMPPDVDEMKNPFTFFSYGHNSYVIPRKSQKTGKDYCKSNEQDPSNNRIKDVDSKISSAIDHSKNIKITYFFWVFHKKRSDS